MSRNAWLTLVAALVAASSPAGATAASPTEQLRAGINRIFTTVGDPALKGADGSVERWLRLRTATEAIFDWAETAQRALGHHWDALTEGQRLEFTRLFSTHLERAYVTQLEQYRPAQITYTGESVHGNSGTVHTTLTARGDADPVSRARPSSERPVDYRMIRHGAQWRVCDVLVDGISIVKNYRAQFDAIIRKGSYQALADRMKTAHDQ